MPPLPTIEDVYRVTLNWVKAGVPTVHNVIHVRAPSLDESEVAEALTDDDVFTSDMFNTMSEDYDLTSLTVLALDGASAGITRAMDTPMPAGAAGQPILELAQVVSLYTTQRGPSGRGRLFVGPVTEGIWDGAGIDPAAVILQQPAWESFVETDLPAALGVGGELVVASYTNAAAYSVEIVTCKTYGATQRRRLVATR